MNGVSTSSSSAPVLARSPGPTYTEVLATDTHPVRDLLVAESAGAFGDTDIPVERYLSREFHELEKRHVWGRCWQMACREEHLPVVGDTYRYTFSGTFSLGTMARTVALIRVSLSRWTDTMVPGLIPASRLEGTSASISSAVSLMIVTTGLPTDR